MAEFYGRDSKLRIFTFEDVELQKKAGRCWIVRHGKVYDVTEFVNDHPGGDDLITQYSGKDIGSAMEDADEHVHSQSAYEMLNEYHIGKIGTQANIVSEDWEADEDFHPDDTNLDEDYVTSEFLDLRKPLVPQMWHGKWSKSFYLQQVHQPRHLSTTARLFGPDWMEILSKTHWWVVPCIWLPIATCLFLRSAIQHSIPIPNFTFDAPLETLPKVEQLAAVPMANWYWTLSCFFLGNFIWTFLEYLFHRFLFHVDYYLPDHYIFLTIHFLTHGVHHYLPMDRLRLVMPPVLFFSLSFPMTRLAYLLFPIWMSNGIIAGAFTFYVLYDCMHYALHHTKLPEYMKEMKKYHLAHHYKNFDLGFGVTSKMWDVVFGTLLPV